MSFTARHSNPLEILRSSGLSPSTQNSIPFAGQTAQTSPLSFYTRRCRLRHIRRKRRRAWDWGNEKGRGRDGPLAPHAAPPRMEKPDWRKQTHTFWVRGRSFSWTDVHETQTHRRDMPYTVAFSLAWMVRELRAD